MRKHISIKVTGRVQGVFFRASTKSKAEELGIHGIVRNEDDGSVHIEAEGDSEILKKFISWCHQGPPNAQVADCVVKDGEIKNFTRFSIQR
jgi:acylphosphatase